MTAIIVGYLLLLGLIFGSFVNALVWRLHTSATTTRSKKNKAQKLDPQKLSIVRGRSMCSSCHHELAAKDLVPLFSWLWLKGRCRYCHRKIEDSPFIEIILPLLFVVSYLAWPMELNGLGIFTLCCWLLFLIGFMALAVYDLRWYLLPDKIVFTLVGFAAVQLLVQVLVFGAGLHVLVNAAVGVLIISGFFYVLYQLSAGRWIGGGDVKLGIVLGMLAGGAIQSLLILFIASLLGSVAAIPSLLTKKQGMAIKIPFGPYLLLATYIVVIWNTRLIDTYYRWLGLM